MAYNAKNRNVVLFGGHFAESVLGETWIWDGANWIQIHPPTSPPAGNYLPMAYDAALGKVVLLDHGQTWLWDGVNWTRIVTSHVPPNDQGLVGAVTYDARNQVIVFFSGSSTWTFDGSDWLQKQPPVSPSYRSSVGLTYDSTAERVLLFGGDTGRYPKQEFNDLWSWDGSTWSQVDAGSGPSARMLPVFVYEPANGVILLIGGTDDINGLNFADMWSWNGRGWTQLPQCGVPPPRYAPASTFDGAQSVVLMFGGTEYAVGYLNDTWAWNQTTWQRKG